MNKDLEQLHQMQENAFNSSTITANYLNGKSIVTSCYRKEIAGTYILLCELSRLDMAIPIEIFYRDGELNQDEITELTALYPQYIQFKKLATHIEDFNDRWGNKKGWATKVYSILESEYSENMWIDSDNIPIRNCLNLFDDDEYKEKGSLFWRDVYSIDRADQYWSGSIMWKVFNVPYNDGEPFESGQFLLNKNKIIKQLELMLYYTNNQQIYYQFGGDAECWRMAWQYVSIKQNKYHAQMNYHASKEVPYGFMPYGPFHKGVPNPWHKYGGGTVMVQRDRIGNELFNHRNITKFSLSGENPINKDVSNELNYHMILRHIIAKYGTPANG